jgi:hypothetical protein
MVSTAFTKGISVVAAICVCGFAAADSSIFIVLDNPASVVNRPSSGSITFEFTGSVTFVGDFSSGQLGGVQFLPFIANSNIGLVTNNTTTDIAAMADFVKAHPEGGTFQGNIFNLVVDSTSTPGLYDSFQGSTFPVHYSLGGLDGDNISVSSNNVNYSLDVNAVPEPTSLLALLGGMPILLRRRRNR